MFQTRRSAFVTNVHGTGCHRLQQRKYHVYQNSDTIRKFVSKWFWQERGWGYNHAVWRAVLIGRWAVPATMNAKKLNCHASDDENAIEDANIKHAWYDIALSMLSYCGKFVNECDMSVSCVYCLSQPYRHWACHEGHHHMHEYKVICRRRLFSFPGRPDGDIQVIVVPTWTRCGCLHTTL